MQRIETPGRRTSGYSSPTPADLRQHFHNYFELLIGAERSKLLRAIDISKESAEREGLLIEIDHSINYLRGAVKMGKLLCLIDQEEAKANLSLLSSERELLRACALRDGRKTQAPVGEAASRLNLIRKSLQPVGHS